METTTAIEALLQTITAFITAAFGWASDVITFIVAPGHELVLLFVLTSFVGIGVSLVRRTIRI